MNINLLRGGMRYLLTGSLLALLPIGANANGLIGTSVTGKLMFATSTTNYYDSANGFVPASGYLNSGGATTVTIASPAVEFGFADTGNTDSANFSASQFTIEDVLATGASGSDTPFVMTFTDAAFAGQTLAKATDFFPNGGLSYSLSGSTITISWAGGPINSNDDYTSTFVIRAVPEPSTWAALVAGACALVFALRRSRNGIA